MGSSTKVSVITGGGSGMGLAAANVIGKQSAVVLAGRTEEKLKSAAEALRQEGIDAVHFVCDIADGKSVGDLASFARGKGRIGSVINAAGMSPHMGEALTIMKTNALGTINVNNAFHPVMESGSCVVNVSSMAAHLIPGFILPRKIYPCSRTDIDRFMKKMMGRVGIFPKSHRSNLAYVISKDFVIWFTRTDAARFGEKGVRVLSVSPGNFLTPMGEVERHVASRYIKHCAIKRFGNVEEIAYLLAACVDEKMGYLTGTDILCDGGCVASGFNPLKEPRS